ncbi:hypothetical protein SESBI_20511 [Sesbania bispinosa]|nr:hypothetical protein SESBI_20511 [Sesbania bispinosa]
MELHPMDFFNDSENELESVTIQLEGEGEESLDLARRSLVGKILWEKALNRGAIKRKAKVVMTNGTWNVMGHLISLQHWVPQASVYEINYDLVPFWVQLHGMPLEYMTTKNVAKIAARLGEVQEVAHPVSVIRKVTMKTSRR